MKYSAAHPESIQEMFNHIAKRYDRTNLVLSLGLYRLWNRRLIREIIRAKGKDLLDLCAGTGEIAYGFLQKKPLANAVLLDFSSEMLEVAKQKGHCLLSRCHFLHADAQQIPWEDNAFDAVTIAYGIRNVKKPHLCAQEAYRVLRPGGTFAILELTRPRFLLLRLLHSLFLCTMMPLIGRIVAENRAAYQYLCQSINHFVSPETLSNILLDIGFSKVTPLPLTGGVATLLVAKK